MLSSLVFETLKFWIVPLLICDRLAKDFIYSSCLSLLYDLFYVNPKTDLT